MISSANTKAWIIESTANNFFAQLTPEDIKEYSDQEIMGSLLQNINTAIDRENQLRGKGHKLKLLDDPTPYLIAKAIREKYNTICLSLSDAHSDTDGAVVAIYVDEGIDKGIYSTQTAYINETIQSMNPGTNMKAIEEVVFHLKHMSPLKQRTVDRDLIIVNNGIFDYKTKTLLPFSPEYIFTNKCMTNYNKDAKPVYITNPDDGYTWDFDSWLDDLEDDEEVKTLLLEVIGASIRPTTKWGKAVFFYSEVGNNGKGTFCAMLRNLIGYSTVSVPLKMFSKEFMLEPLIGSTSIIVDENDVGTYIDESANLKAVITEDIISINRKHKIPVTYKFRGLMVQCINEYPRVKDTSPSFLRRLLIVPFNKSFTGKERRYIKEDYLARQDVLEYILYKILHMKNYYELSAPEVTKEALEAYRTFNNSVEEFVRDIFPQISWSFMPTDALYGIYKGWYRRFVSSSNPISSKNFIKDVNLYLNTSTYDIGWRYVSNKRISEDTFSSFERLVVEYKVEQYYDSKTFSSNDEDYQRDLTYMRDKRKSGYVRTKDNNNPIKPDPTTVIDVEYRPIEKETANEVIKAIDNVYPVTDTDYKNAAEKLLLEVYDLLEKDSVYVCLLQDIFNKKYNTDISTKKLTSIIEDSKEILSLFDVIDRQRIIPKNLDPILLEKYNLDWLDETGDIKKENLPQKGKLLRKK